MLSNKNKTKNPKFWHATVSMIFMIAVVLVSIIVLGAEPQIPLILGCAVAGIVAVAVGFSWDEILEGMIKGISQSLEAILILLLIGMLVGTWIACGTVPTIIYYGLKIISANYFPLACMLICTIISLAIGAWGTVGTIGIAFMGIGLALNIPAPLVAGSIISGAYLGEILSPLSDATNLAAGIVGENVFDAIKKVIKPAIIAFVLSSVLYLLLGLRYAGGDGSIVTENVGTLLKNLESSIKIGPAALIPMVMMIVCILIKIPAIPSMLIGIISGAVLAFTMQGSDIASILGWAYSGYVSDSGSKMVDSLLTAGGLTSMMNTISIIVIAMGFGGIMQSTGQMGAFVAPMVKLVKSKGGLKSLTVVFTILMNLFMADQYLGISVPGKMFEQSFKKRGMDGADLSSVLLGGGATTSPLVPWNTCGMYVSGLLGVGTLAYLPYSFISLSMPVLTIIMGFIIQRKKNSEVKQESSDISLPAEVEEVKNLDTGK